MFQSQKTQPMESNRIIAHLSPNAPTNQPILPPPRRLGTPVCIWRLKESLDESFEVQKTIIQSQSVSDQTVSIQIGSTESNNNSTSILQQKSTPCSSRRTFLDLLREKSAQSRLIDTPKTSKTPRSTRLYCNKTPYVNKQKLSQWRYLSQEKHRIRQLQLERSSILQQIDNELQPSKTFTKPKLIKERCCTCGGMAQQSQRLSTTHKSNQTGSSTNKISTLSEVVMDNLEDLQSNKTTVILEENPQSKMMKNILNLKQKLRAERQNYQIQPQVAFDTDSEWYKLPEHMLPQDLDIEQTLKGQKTVSFKHPSDCSQHSYSHSNHSQEINRVLECLLTSQFLSDAKSDASRNNENIITFGELSRNKMKEQIEMIKRHIKKVSIDLEEKQNVEVHHKKKSL